MADGDLILIPQNPNLIPDGLTLGRHINHDPASRAFAAVPPVGVQIHTVRHEIVRPNLDQDGVSGCTFFTGLNVMGTRPLWNGSWAFTNDDGFRGYARTTELDPFPGTFTWPPPGGQDTGSDGNSACKTLREWGVIASWDHAFNIDQLLAALMSQPVMTGTPWFQAMFYPDADGRITPSGSLAGGHEWEIFGYDTNTGDLDGRTSWGAWGPRRDGTFKINIDVYAKSLLAQNGDVTIPRVAAPGPQPPPGPSPTPPPAPSGTHVYGTQFGRYYHRATHRFPAPFVYDWPTVAAARAAGRMRCLVCLPPAGGAGAEDDDR